MKNITVARNNVKFLQKDNVSSKAATKNGSKVEEKHVSVQSKTLQNGLQSLITQLKSADIHNIHSTPKR